MKKLDYSNMRSYSLFKYWNTITKLMNNLGKIATIVVMLSTILVVPSMASQVSAQQATGQATIVGTCGLSFPNSNLVNYGALLPNTVSAEIGLDMTNSGTVTATLDVGGTNWVDSKLFPQMLVNRTHYNVTSSQGYANNLLLQEYDTPITASFIPAVLLQTFWQLQATLLNPSFTGSATQTMDFTVSC